MCLAIPGKVQKIEGKQVVVQYPGESRLAMVSDEKPKVGDFVMVHMGIVVKILSPEEAQACLKAWTDH